MVPSLSCLTLLLLVAAMCAASCQDKKHDECCAENGCAWCHADSKCVTCLDRECYPSDSGEIPVTETCSEPIHGMVLYCNLAKEAKFGAMAIALTAGSVLAFCCLMWVVRRIVKSRKSASDPSATSLSAPKYKTTDEVPEEIMKSL
eukprot:Sspe_Gene.115245::Locus_102241_Transcript_1_1_Confidence_1.000_Length_774::g.115245::m.115245